MNGITKKIAKKYQAKLNRLAQRGSVYKLKEQIADMANEANLPGLIALQKDVLLGNLTPHNVVVDMEGPYVRAALTDAAGHVLVENFGTDAVDALNELRHEIETLDQISKGRGKTTWRKPWYKVPSMAEAEASGMFDNDKEPNRASVRTKALRKLAQVAGTKRYEFDNDEGEVEVLEVPMKWEICDYCRGSGGSSSYLEPEGGGFTMSEFQEAFPDPEDQDAYFSGAYDRQCEECRGSGKVRVPAMEQLTNEDRAKLEAYFDEEDAYRRMVESERRYGA